MKKALALQSPERYTAETLEQMRSQFTRAAMERALHARVGTIFRQERESFIELGRILLEVDTLELWREAGMTSTAQWIQDAAPASERSCYAALKAVRRCTGVPLEDLKEVPRCNIAALSEMNPKDQIRPKVLKAAKELPERQFKEFRAAEFPNEHFECDSPMRFKPTESQRKVVDAALDGVMLLEELTSREEALEAICVAWLDEHRQRLESAVREKGRAASA